MQRRIRTYPLVGIASVVVILCAIGIIIYSVNQAKMNASLEAQRHHVFCELLKPTMTLAEVRDVLAHFGSFEERKNSFTGTYTLAIVYTGSTTERQFTDGVLLRFRKNDDRYMGASIQVSLSDRAPLCEESK